MADSKDYIVIEGSIGVGKTTLARRLGADLKASLLLEQVDSNPFLENFYHQPERLALATQLHFLMDRVEQIQVMAEHRVIADYLLDKDFLFAQLNLSEAELALYLRIFSRVAEKVRKPDLVVYLQAPVSVLLSRVSQRGRRFEKPMDSTYLNRLNDAYANFFHYYEESPLLIVNAAEIDFAHNEGDYQALYQRILSMGRGREFFNPLPEKSL